MIVTLIANGINQPVRWDDAVAAARVLLDTGRAVPFGPWVERIVREKMEEKSAALPHHRI